jgi:hypothetical protein
LSIQAGAIVRSLQQVHMRHRYLLFQSASCHLGCVHSSILCPSLYCVLQPAFDRFMCLAMHRHAAMQPCIVVLMQYCFDALHSGHSKPQRGFFGGFV